MDALLVEADEVADPALLAVVEDGTAVSLDEFPLVEVVEMAELGVGLGLDALVQPATATRVARPTPTASHRTVRLTLGCRAGSRTAWAVAVVDRHFALAESSRVRAS